MPANYYLPLLLVPEKTDIEFEQIYQYWNSIGGEIRRLGKYWIKDDEITRQRIAIYGNQTFSLVLAQIYKVELLSPDDTLISRLDNKWTKRSIKQMQIKQIEESLFPIFIKPVIPKIFLAGIFANVSDFNTVTRGLMDTEEVLVSDIVYDLQAEVRSFIMNGEIRDIALYEGNIDVDGAEKFLTDFLFTHQHLLPRVVVIDLAYADSTGWFILEFNACWGAGLNNCSAEKVMESIIGATVTQQ